MAARQQQADAERAARAAASLDMLRQLCPDLPDLEAAAHCHCGCHPKPADTKSTHPQPDCDCQVSAEERSARQAQAFADILAMSEPWPEDDQAHEQLADTAAELGVSAEWRVMAAPTVVSGFCEDRAFYLRERHGHYQVCVALAAGPLPGAGNLWDLPAQEPTIQIAEGAGDFTGDPARAVRTAVDAVRAYLRRIACRHEQPGDWCSACGIRLADRHLWVEPPPDPTDRPS